MRENDRIRQNLAVQSMVYIGECHALVQDRRRYVELTDMVHERMMEESKQSRIQLLKKTTLDDHQDHRTTQDERSAWTLRNLNSDIVLNVRIEISENLIDEYKVYDELDDDVQYRKYWLLMDNNHICKFLILEPRSKFHIEK